MKNNVFGKWLLSAVLMVATLSLTSCVDDNDDKGLPFLELGAAELAFTNEGGDAIFKVNSNRPWTVTLGEDSEWIVVDPMEGVGAADVEISIPATDRGRVGTIHFHVANTYDVYMTETVTVRQGEVEADEVLWHEHFGSPSQGSSGWPLVADYSDWEKGGTAGAAVKYEATSGKVSVRASGSLSAGYADASSGGKLFFGTGNPAFVASGIATGGKRDFTINFGGNYYNYDSKDDTFDPAKFHLYISGDNKKWSAVAYKVVEASDGWNYITAKFSLTEGADQLSVLMIADEASVFALDDTQLVSGGAGGTVIDLAQGTENPYAGGSEPDPTPTPDGPETTDLPAAGKYMFVWTVDGKAMAATPAETYYLLPQEVTVTNNEIAAAGNEAAVWTIEAATAKNLFTIKGSDGSYYTMKGDYNSFNKVGALGEADYAYNWAFTKNADGTFKVLNYEKQKWMQWDAQYNNVSASTKDGAMPKLYRLNEAGTAYVGVVEGGSEPDPTPTPTPTPTDAIWYESFGTPAKEGSYWPYAAESTVNEMLGTGVVAGTTTYASSNVTARTVASQSSPTPPCSGNGHVWFPANKTIDKNYFTVEKLALNGETKLDVTFYLYGNSAVYKEGDVVLALSANGTTWVDVAFTTAAVTEATTDWVKATASVTLKSAVEQLYVRFSSATTAGVRMDDPRLTAGQGGTEVDLAGGSTPEPEPDPTPSAALSVKELVQLMIAGTTYTDKTVEGYVAAFGGSGTENVSQGTIVLTDNDGAEYSGLTVYKYDLSSLGLKVGDKIQIKLTNATTGDYNGLRQLATVANEDVTVLSSGATISYKQLTGAQLNADYAKYLSVPVEIANAKPDAASVGKTFTASLTFNDGTDFTVYNRSKWAAGAEVTVNEVTAAVRGVVSVYGSNAQLVPTSKADIEAFGQSSTTPDPEPDPTPEPEPTPDPGTGGGTDDFATLTNATSYGEQTTAAGWKGVNCAVQSGGENDSNPVFKSLLGEDANVKGMVINGKTSGIGVITSPTLTGGCGTLTFDYGYAFSESNGISFKVEIMQAGAVVKSFEVTDASATKLQKYSFSQQVGVAGDFQIVITNNCPSQSTKNKDRYTIFNIKWTAQN